MALCLVNTPDDLVIILAEECVKCTDRKLGVLQRWPLASGEVERRRQIADIKQQCGFSITVARAYYQSRKAAAKTAEKLKGCDSEELDRFHEELWLGPRMVRSHCDCN